MTETISEAFQWQLQQTMKMRGGCELMYHDAERGANLLVESSSRGKTWTTFWLDGEAQDFPDEESFLEHVGAVQRRDPTVMEVRRLRNILAKHNINPDTGNQKADPQ